MPTPNPDPASLSAVRHLFPVAVDPKVLAATWTKFCVPLQAVAARYLGPQVRQRVDPEDVVVSAYRTLYRRAKAAAIAAAPADGPPLLDDPNVLWKVLLTVTIRKAINKRIAELRTKRSVAATISGEGPDWAGAAADPTPAELAEQAESIAAIKSALAERFGSGPHRRIAELILDGLSPREIAQRVGCVERTVYRVKQQLEEAAVACLGEGNDVGQGRP